MNANLRLAPPLLAAGLLVLLTACGGSSSGAAATPAGATASPQPGNAVTGGRGLPGTSGLLAALDGRTLQVQSQQAGQVAVTYTAKTTFAKTVSVARSAVTVGSCVNVRSTTATATSGAVTAASVSISTPVNGSCTGRGAGFSGGGPGGPGGARPSGAPTALPSGAPSGAAGFRPTAGKVTAVSGSSFTVAAVDFGKPGATPSATPSTSPVRVSTGAATTYISIVAATACDLKVGQCVQALGSADDTGAVTATRISTEPAVGGQCGFGFDRTSSRGGR